MTIPVLSASQASAWDQQARTRHKIPSRVLMESAGRACAWVIGQRFTADLARGVIVAAGPGNNGGDGWVVARALHAVGVQTRVVEAGSRRSEDCAANRTLALAAGIATLEADGAWPSAGLVVDALLGTGAEGGPRGRLGALATRMGAFGAPVVAIDGPTGLDLTTGEAHGPVRAALTITFGGVRRGHLLARDWCGDVVMVDIGFPPADTSLPTLVDDRWARDVLPSFHASMHKGNRGKLLVVGGDEGMAGAAIHAARSALAAGAGMVRLVAAEPTIRAAQEVLPDALTTISRLGPEVEPDVRSAVEWADAVVVGPGIGRSDARQAFVKDLLGTTRPAVVDADALHFGGANLGCRRGDRVLTPHAGEFAAAFPDIAMVDRFAAAEQAAKTSGATVLLKGVPTVIANGKTSRVVASGNPSLATGGSGDVLSGLIGAFLAAGVSPVDAASLGAHAMGRAAEIAALDNSARGSRPADVIAALPRLWKQWTDQPGAAVPPILCELPAPLLT